MMPLCGGSCIMHASNHCQPVVHTSQKAIRTRHAAKHCPFSFANPILLSALLLQAEGDQEEDAPSLGLFAAKLYLYLGELKFAKLDMCAPVLGASKTPYRTPPWGAMLSASRAASGPWLGVGSNGLSTGPTLGKRRGLPVWQGTQCCARPGAYVQATETGHQCCCVPGTQASSRATACQAEHYSKLLSTMMACSKHQETHAAALPRRQACRGAACVRHLP